MVKQVIINMVECIVIGAGVIGLAVARALAIKNMDVIILEAAATFGTETSARNSDVIHAGIYNQPGSLKAKLCVEGKSKIYTYCQNNNIANKKIGKLIVATNEVEFTKLLELYNNAKANGILDLELLNATQLKNLEPNIHGIAALFSPSSGIMDTKCFMASLLKDAKTHGARLLVNHEVTSGKVLSDRISLKVINNNAPIELQAKHVINCSGLYASQISNEIIGLSSKQIPITYYRKGNYFFYNATSPFRHLIYPVPVPGGLGTHATLDLQGGVRFGPDVEWVEHIDYQVNPARAILFEKAVAQYWPSIQSKFLQPGYAGIRPSLADIHGGFKDFCITEHELINTTAKFIGLYGIESPGLTASLAIADYVTSM